MRLSMLDRKLLRDLWLIKGQGLSIALVIAAGVAIYVLMLSTLDSLELTRAVYYDRYRFADVFAGAKRAPLRLVDEIRLLPGVAAAEPRVVVDVTVDVEGFSDPVTGRLISIPADHRPALCDVFVQKGHYLDPDRDDEVLVSANFAGAHGLEPGDSIAAVINGRRKQLHIAGLALSPEYVYQIRPGELMPDDKRFGILWMEHRALATAYRMEGGFNNILLKLRRDASVPAVIERVDQLLNPYGGFGAIPRRLQMSHWFLENELVQLRSFGSTIPVLFLGVAAFLLNVVLTRIVSVQREQIGALKALGYSDRSIAVHYLKWAVAISLVGSLVGLAAGIRLGEAMTELYNQFFHFPILLYRLRLPVAVQSVGISLAVAVIGAVFAARRALRLPPAEAMRPESPPVYRSSVAERFGLRRFLSQPGRIIVRSLERRPLRALISVVGISAATALLILGTFSEDAIHDFIEIQFNRAQRYDLLITFVEPASAGARHELARLPGVLDLEPFRSVPARLIHGHRWRDMAITGVPAHARLNRILDASKDVVELPPDGLALSSVLAESLGLRPGDSVQVQVREGRQPRLTAIVHRLIDDYMGVNAYMDLSALRRLMGEGEVLSGAYLRADPRQLDRLYTRLKNTPAVAGVALKNAALEAFNETYSAMMGTMRVIYTIFAGLIALGVVYNSARVSLAERARELATLRVIGFSRKEVSFILLGELALITLASIPIGMLFGRLSVSAIMKATESEAFRFPVVVSIRTLVLAAGTIAAAAWLSAMVVRRKLNRLDLVESLKLRE